MHRTTTTQLPPRSRLASGVGVALLAAVAAAGTEPTTTPGSPANLTEETTVQQTTVQQTTVQQTTAQETTVQQFAEGTFDVAVTALPAEPATTHPTFPRHAIAKTFHGDLEGTSEGLMMSVDTPTEGSAAYVAIERVTGTVAGRQGTFSLVHRGTMRRGGDFDLQVGVVPDSGTGQLVGLAGTMTITIRGREHSYRLTYTLPAAP